MQPVLKLADEGIFAHLRNPMYVGMALLVLGIVIFFALEWTLFALIVGALVMHFGVVLREERYLERKFGDDYRRYKDERAPLRLEILAGHLGVRVGAELGRLRVTRRRRRLWQVDRRHAVADDAARCDGRSSSSPPTRRSPPAPRRATRA